MSDNTFPPPGGEPQPYRPPAAPASGQPAVPAMPPTPPYPPTAPPYPPTPQGYAAPQAPYGTPQGTYGAAQPPYGSAQAPATYPSPYGAPAYGAAAYAAPRPNSGLAIASLVCGLAGVVLFWLGVTAIVSLVAVITGHMALKQMKTNPSLAGRGMAITGLITGYVGIGILVVEIALVVVTFLAFGAFSLPFIFNS